MWRHPVFERFQIARQRFRIHAPRRKCIQIVRVAVQALSAGYQLLSAEQQVKRVRKAGSCRVRMRIERPLGHRETADEYEVGAVLTQSPLTQPTLVRRREVRLTEHLLTSCGMDHTLGF